MKTNFKDYLEKKHAQTIIDKFALEYKDKKVILYGAELFAGDLFRNYDLSELNIIGVSDRDFERHREGDYYGYKKISPLDLLETEFDLLLITEYDDSESKEYLKKDLFHDKDIKFKIKTLIKLNIIEFIHDTVNGDI